MSRSDTETTGIRAIDAISGLIMFAATINFAHYAIQGDFGLFALMEIEREESALRNDLAAMRAERAELERLADGLNAASPDLDLLDERARDMLGLLRPDEIRLR